MNPREPVCWGTCTHCKYLSTCTYPSAVHERGELDKEMSRMFPLSSYPSTTHHPETLPAFYMCYVAGTMSTRPPTCTHQTRDAAIAEAERLAKVTGKRVYVLAATDTVRYELPVSTKYPVWRQTDQ